MLDVTSNEAAIESHAERETIEELFRLKCGHQDHFASATLTRDVPMRAWNGRHPVEKNQEAYTALKGSQVLITVVSRFGDACIRGRRVEALEHGYHARVDFGALANIKILGMGGE